MGSLRMVAGAATFLLAAGAVLARQQGGSDDGYVPTLPKNYLPQEVKSPFQGPFGGWGITQFRWADLMGATPIPPNPHTGFLIKPAGPTSAPKPTLKPNLNLPGLPNKPVSGGGVQNSGSSAWFNICFAKIKFGLCRHQLKWSDGWTQLPLSATGIRVVGPMAVRRAPGRTARRSRSAGPTSARS